MFKESFFPFLPNETVTPSPINPTRSDAIKIISPGGKSSQDKPDLLDKVEMIFTEAAPVLVRAWPVLPVRQGGNPCR